MTTADADELHDEVNLRLERIDQRYTSNRRRVVEVLAAADRPLVITELLDEADDLTQSSTYRNLRVLEEAGVVRRLVFDAEHARFELGQDLLEHHHHLICEDCGAVTDISLGAEAERAIDRALHDAAAKHGFAPGHHDVDLYGRCSACT